MKAATRRTLGKMKNYVELADRDIATEKEQNEALQDELVRARRLIESLQSKLDESEAQLVRQQQMKWVSEFEMEKLESGGTVRVIMQK